MIKLDGARELRSFRKGSDAAARLQFVIDELNDLQNAGALDADADGDGSEAPDVRGLIAQAAALLGALTNEETPDRDGDAAPAAQPLQMTAHSHAAGRHGGAPLTKVGARNSEADQSRVQKLHDTAVELGAACGGAQKFAAGVGLEKKFDALVATLADVLQRVKQIESQPLPLPFAGQARAITKNERLRPRYAWKRGARKAFARSGSAFDPRDQTRPTQWSLSDALTRLVSDPCRDGSAPRQIPLRKPMAAELRALTRQSRLFRSIRPDRANGQRYFPNSFSEISSPGVTDDHDADELSGRS